MDGKVSIYQLKGSIPRAPRGKVNSGIAYLEKSAELGGGLVLPRESDQWGGGDTQPL